MTVTGQRNHVEALFSKINSRGFYNSKPTNKQFSPMSANTQVNSDGKLVASLPVFKLLAISQDVLNPTEINYSREIDTNEAIRTVAGTMYDEYLKSGDSDTQQLLDTQNILDTVGVVYEKLRTQFLAARSAKNVMSQNYLSNKMKLYQVGIGDNREVYIEGVRSLFKRCLIS